MHRHIPHIIPVYTLYISILYTLLEILESRIYTVHNIIYVYTYIRERERERERAVYYTYMKTLEK